MSKSDLYRESQQDGAPTDTEYAADMQAEHEWLMGTDCDCGKAKLPGDSMCAACAHLEEQEAGRDYEEEERQERLLKALPDGDYTASELQEYLS